MKTLSIVTLVFTIILTACNNYDLASGSSSANDNDNDNDDLAPRTIVKKRIQLIVTSGSGSFAESGTVKMDFDNSGNSNPKNADDDGDDDDRDDDDDDRDDDDNSDSDSHHSTTTGSYTAVWNDSSTTESGTYSYRGDDDIGNLKLTPQAITRTTRYRLRFLTKVSGTYTASYTDGSNDKQTGTFTDLGQ